MTATHLYTINFIKPGIETGKNLDGRNEGARPCVHLSHKPHLVLFSAPLTYPFT